MRHRFYVFIRILCCFFLLQNKELPLNIIEEKYMLTKRNWTLIIILYTVAAWYGQVKYAPVNNFCIPSSLILQQRSHIDFSQNSLRLSLNPDIPNLMPFSMMLCAPNHYIKYLCLENVFLSKWILFIFQTWCHFPWCCIPPNHSINFFVLTMYSYLDVFLCIVFSFKCILI